MINIVLYNPEMGGNAGNIMRTCVATNARLHMIKPLGFDLDPTKLNRFTAGYFDLCDTTVYENYQEFLDKNIGDMFFITRYGSKSPDQFDYSDHTRDIYFIFGSESSGLPKEILKDNLDNCMRLPMTDKARSLNLSNCAAILAYEALRQQNYSGLCKEEPEVFKGKDFLKN